MFKSKNKKPYLEVFPEDGTGTWQVRIKARNGRVLFYSGSEGYSRWRAIRAAKTFAEHMSGLEIRVLDIDGGVQEVL